jgi:hypothetical protein
MNLRAGRTGRPRAPSSAAARASAKLERAAYAVGSRRGLAVALVGGLSFGLAVAISAVRVPVPRLHDEFSYLLAADTFAHGRLANPTHPMWHHFETFHVLQQPTYASKYPPAQGLFLALGQRLGHPIAGVWLATALAAAACCWMLQGWVPARFALLGGWLVAFHHGLQFYWHGYWGGSVALLGGALLYGALPRLWRRPRVSSTCVLVAGVVLLANSRPYTGFVACLPVAAALAVRLLGRRRPPFAASLARVVLPALLLLGLSAGAMAYYNARVTGDPLRLPYQEHSAQYAFTPVFLWQEPGAPPAYRNAMFERFHLDWQAEGFRAQQSLWEAFRRKREMLYFFLTPLLLAPLATAPWMLRSRRTRFALASALLVFVASLGVAGSHAHYLAPAAPLLFLLVVQGLRQVSLWRWRGRAAGKALVAGVALLQASIFAAALALTAAQAPPAWALRRAAIETELSRTPGEHLVIVRYADDHSPHEEWVWNAADIDAAKVVWARALGPAEDGALIAYFSGRRLWSLAPDRAGGELVELPRGGAAP